MANGQTVSGAPADVVVVAADADRLGQYEAALRTARVPTRATLDADEAEALVSGLNPDVLVLDRGLPRLILFRLYGLVRADASETPVQVVFVGQEGDTGPDDHYLPGDPSPSNVAERVTSLLASVSPAPTTVPANDIGPERAGGAAEAAPPPDSAPPARPGAQAATAGAAAAAVTAAGTSVAAAPETNGTAAEADAEAEAESEGEAAPAKSGRRLDVIMIRIGLVLLILGALLILIQSDAFPPALTPPGSAPVTPTRRPAASPKPGAFFEAPAAPVSLVGGPRRA